MAETSIQLTQKLQFKMFTGSGTAAYASWATSGQVGEIGFNEVTKKIKVNGVEYGLSPEETAKLAAVVETLQNNGLLNEDGTEATYLIDPNAAETGATAALQAIINRLQNHINTEITNASNQYKTAIYSASLTGINGNNLFVTNTGSNFSGISGHIDGADIAVGTGRTETHTYAASSVANAIEDIDARIKSLDNDSEITLWKGETEWTGSSVTADGVEYTLKQGSTAVAKFNIEKDSFVKAGTVVYCPADTTEGEKEDPVSEETTEPTTTNTTPFIKLTIKTTDDDTEKYIYIKAVSLVDVYTGTSTTTIDVAVSADNKISATINDYSLATSHLSTSAYNELTNDVHSVNISGATVHVGDDTTTNYESSAVTGVVSVTINGATVKTTTEITGATTITSGTTIDSALQAIDTKLKEVEDAKTGSVVDWGTVTGAAIYSKSDTSTGVILNIDVEGTSVAVASGPTTGSGVAGATSGFKTYDSSSSVAQAVDAVNIAAKQYADSLITWEVVSNS